MPEIMFRDQAVSLGLKRYFPGYPCKHGHLGERYASSGLCTECERQTKLRYYRNNAARCRAARAKYMEKARPHYIEKARERRQENPEPVRAKGRQYYWRHREKRLEQSRHRQSEEVRLARAVREIIHGQNPRQSRKTPKETRIRERRQWQKNDHNRALVAASARRRRTLAQAAKQILSSGDIQ